MKKLWLLFFTLFASVGFAASSQPIAVNVQAIKTTALANANHTSSNPADAAVYGKPIDLGLSTFSSVQCTWAGLTGTINATVQVFVSNDGTNWVVKSDSSGQPVEIDPAGAAGTNLISLNAVVSEAFYEVVYVHGGVTGGTIGCQVWGK